MSRSAARLRTTFHRDAAIKLAKLLKAAIDKLPPIVGTSYRSINIEGRANLQNFLAKHQRGDSVKWDSSSSVGSVLGGTMANSNIVFEIQNSTAYDITDFVDGMAYNVRPNPRCELIIPAGAELEVVDAIEVSPGNWKIVLKQTGAGSIGRVK